MRKAVHCSATIAAGKRWDDFWPYRIPKNRIDLRSGLNIQSFGCRIAAQAELKLVSGPSEQLIRSILVVMHVFA